jgi:hypothetical protein
MRYRRKGHETIECMNRSTHSVGLLVRRSLFYYFRSRVMRPEEMDAIFPINCVFIAKERYDNQTPE